MPYIGKSPVGGGFHKLDALTASATATYALTLNSAAYFPETANQLLVSLNGVIQAPQDSFTVSGSNLVFDTALTASDSIDFVVALGDVLSVGSVTDGAVTANKIGTDAVTTAKIQDGAVTSSKIASGAVSSESYAIIGDVKSSGTNGGSSVVGWQTRDLNTELFDPDGIVSIASNKFTLGAGSYVVSWMCQSYRSNQQKSKLVNDTDSTDVQVGLAQYASSTATNTQSSTGSAGFTISGSKAFKIEHYISNAQSANGLGVNIGSTGDEIYTLVNITKLA